MEDKVTRKRIVGRIPITPTGDQKDGRPSSRIVTQRMSLLIRQIPQKMNVLSAVNKVMGLMVVFIICLIPTTHSRILNCVSPASKREMKTMIVMTMKSDSPRLVS